MIPVGIFEIQIQPLINGETWLKAIAKPIIVDMEGGSGTVQLITGYEIISDKLSGACHISELNWLIESGQYKVISPAKKTRLILKANHNNKDRALESTKPK